MTRFAMTLLLTLMTSTPAWADDTYTSYNVTAGIGNTYGNNSNWTALLDNNTGSKWCCLLGSGIYVEFNTPNAIIPTGYILTTAEDTQTYPNRNPTAWVLYGKRNQGDAWTLLDSKTNNTSMPASNNTDVIFTFSNSQAYKYFRFEVSAVNGLQNNDQYNNQPAAKFQLAELRLMGNDYVSGNSPTTVIESLNGKHGSIYVKGWCEDPDAPSTPLTIQVFVKDGNSQPVEGYNPINLTANLKRFGEDNQWHYNGFDHYLPITTPGTYEVDFTFVDATGDSSPIYSYSGIQVAAPYIVTYDANGGSGAPAQQQKGEGAALTLSSIVPTRDGYNFQRWTTAQNGGGTAYSPGAAYTDNANATLYAQWVASDFPGSGTADDPYVISTAGQWNLFASNVNNGNTYSGKYFALGADITVSTMAGTYDTPFSGTFVGTGHTMNLAINGTGTGGGHPNIAVAPFRYVNGATFKYINLTGTITRNDYPDDSNVSLGGLIGILSQNRNVTIIGCHSSVSINYNFTWDSDNGALGTYFTTGHMGGFIGWSDGNAIITDCLFDGTLAGRPLHQGGFVGYLCWGGITFNNCLMNGTSSATSTYRGNFFGSDNNGGAGSLNNCYYKNSIDAQGTSTNATGETLRTLLGNGWIVNGSDAVVPCPTLTLDAEVDNRTAIADAAGAGTTFNSVQIDGLTLYRDGTWNTIVLPFNLTTLTGTPLEGATLKTLASSNYTTQNDGMLTLTFADATSIEAGKPYIAKWGADLIIRSASDWNAFADNVNNGIDSYQGKVVKLAANITVSTMVGIDNTSFKGTFDGCGYTLTFNKTATGAYCAPFCNTADATFRNLKVAGTINTGYRFAGGLICLSTGSCTIENCQSSIIINTSVNGDGTHGGFIACCNFGSGGTISFTNCLFNGTISGSNTSHCGGYVGWRSGSLAMTFTNCLMAGSMNITLDGNTAIFYRTNGAAASMNHSYYKGSYGNATKQGTVTSATGETLRAQLGDDWEVSGDNVVPRLTSTIENPMFTNVTLSNATANIETTYASLNGSYKPFSNSSLVDAHNTSRRAMHAAISFNQPLKTGYTLSGWYTDAARQSAVTTIPFADDGTVTLYAKWTLGEQPTGIPYLKYNTETEEFETLYAASYTAVNSKTTTWNNNTWYVVQGTVTISSRITVSGTAHLILLDDATLTASAGIHVASGKTLNIYAQSDGTGRLNANASTNQHAGIGSNGAVSNGTITIHGGVITATCSGGEGSGIGAGGQPRGTFVVFNNSGRVNIHGGTIIATGGDFGAGIGGGNFGESGNITITGGTITATGGANSAGIGGGCDASANTITITGGTIYATGNNGQAIGKGSGTSSTEGTLTLGDMKVYSSASATNPVNASNRVSTCRSSYAKVMLCTSHTWTNGTCSYCGTSHRHVTYNGNNATVGTVPTDATEYEPYQFVTVLGNSGNLERTGYSFAGWNTKADGSGTLYSEGSTFIIKQNTTLYADWTPVVELTGNTDNSSAISAAAADGKPHRVVLAGHTLYKDGSWNTLVLPFNLVSLNGTPLEGFLVKTLETSYFSDQTLTLSLSYATNIKAGKPYIVKWTSTGDNIVNPVFEDVLISNATANVETTYADFIGSYAPISADGLLHDAHNPNGDAMHAAISIDGPTREGYTIGWYTDAGLTVPATTIPFDENGNVTLYAKWIPTEYTITYNLNGGTNHADNPATYNIESETITLQEPAKTNYSFGGWFDNEDCTGDAVTSIVSGSYGDITLYAKWLVEELALANNGNNSDAISVAAASGLYHNVTLTDRTIYRDGDWNTLVLPFNLSSFDDTALEGATVKTLESTDFSDGTLTMNFSDDQTSIEAGKPYIVKWDGADFTIRSSADWSTFASNVGNYQNKTVKLATDLSVSSMVGGTFNGTLDGCGHTITVSLSSGSTEQIALFNTLGNATIKNLKIAGNITFGKHRPASIASYISGTTTIKNCWSCVKINSSYRPSSADWVDGGAFVARVNSGATINMSDCLFTGSITYKTKNNQGGGMVGWTQGSNSTANLTHCLFAPSSMTMTATDPKGKTYVFVSGEARGNLSGCYYNSVANNVNSSVLKKEGTYTTATGSDLLALLGDGWKILDGQVVPKMINSAGDIENPVFNNVTISNTTADVSTTYVDFVGTYSPVIYNDENRSVLFLGGGSTLYYPDGQNTTTIGSCRAYFTLNGITAGDKANEVKAFVLNFGDDETTDSLTPNPTPVREGSAGAWYDLGGRPLTLDPRPSTLKKGIYIHNGKKVIIK